MYRRQTSYSDQEWRYHFHYRSKYLPLKPAGVLMLFKIHALRNYLIISPPRIVLSSHSFWTPCQVGQSPTKAWSCSLSQNTLPRSAPLHFICWLSKFLCGLCALRNQQYLVWESHRLLPYLQVQHKGITLDLANVTISRI